MIAGAKLCSMISRMRDAGPHDVRRQAEYFDIALVADDHAQVRVEHAQPVRHIVERHVEAAMLLLQLFRARSRSVMSS